MSAPPLGAKWFFPQFTTQLSKFAMANPGADSIDDLTKEEEQKAEQIAIITATAATGRPWARLTHIGDRQTRMADRDLRIAYAFYIRGKQAAHNIPVLPACGNCGLPAGNFCDECNGPYCNPCEEAEEPCRLCG